MKSVIFCFATHNHQPIGNFDNIIEEAYEKSYRPFFEIASKYPDFRFGTHYTGMLLEWLRAKHPEYLQGIKTLVARKQLEIVGGGYYEPILSIIPPHDQLEQLKKLSQTIQQEFDYTPKGIWLAERVWEQHLASVINRAGNKYVIVDDTHFLGAGLRESDLTGYYLTEDEGRTLAVFPISKSLRYTIPFAPVDETIKVLSDAASESGDVIVCFADDGEKFGVWPNTFDHVYRDGWLEEFFRKISENKSWIRTMHLAEAVEQIKPKGRIYLPNASYAEMMQWALPSAKVYQEYEDFVHKLEEEKEEWSEYLPFVRGGYWRNFLVKYPESNHLQKHIWRTSKRHDELSTTANNTELLDAAYQKLLTAECNDPFWHGVFGGIYLTNLRHANYTALVEADRLLDESEGLSDVRITREDFNCDGSDEVIVESKNFSLYLTPGSGGRISELDFKPANFNATNILNRQQEAYHAKVLKAEQGGANTESKSIHDMVLTKESGLEKFLIYDWYSHACFLDHFLPVDIAPEALLEGLAAMKFEEQGDFLTQPYECHYEGDQNERNATAETMLRLQRTGNLWQNGEHKQIEVRKELRLRALDNALEVHYYLKNVCNSALRFRFASEWVFNLLAGNAHDRFYETDAGEIEDRKMESVGVTHHAGEFRLKDEYLKLAITLRMEQRADVFRFPIQTVSLSEAGFERVYQGSVLLPSWQVSLEPGSEWSMKFNVEFSPL